MLNLKNNMHIRIKELIKTKRNNNEELNKLISEAKPQFGEIFSNIEPEKVFMFIPLFEHLDSHCLKCSQVTHLEEECDEATRPAHCDTCKEEGCFTPSGNCRYYSIFDCDDK